MHIFNCILFFFIHPQPNNIDPARQQPRSGALLISLRMVGGGGGQSLYLLALRLLDCMRFAMEASTEWKMGGTHSSPTALGLGISAPPPPNTHPKFPSFCLGLGGGTNVFYPQRPDYRFKIPSFTSRGHTHSLVCAPTATFSFSRAVMSYK